jgi:NAD(P)H-flavin reductase
MFISNDMMTVSPQIVPAGPVAQSASYLPYSCRILRRVQETSDTFTFVIEAHDRLPAPFRPGQFNMLSIPGVGEVPISISGFAAETNTVVHTTRAVGSVTRELERLQVGQYVGLRGPYGTGWPLEALEGRDVIVLAGGIGLAPLRPVLYHILADRTKFRRLVLLYGARTPGDLLFRDELLGWQMSSEIDVRITVDRASRFWRGHVGVITALVSAAHFDPSNAVALVCGPEAMMRFTVHELNGRGLTSQRIFASMERNMKCAFGLCGHCQYGPSFVCKDGPVYRFDRIEPYFPIREF